MVLHVKIPSYWTAQREKWAFTKWHSLNMKALEWMSTSVQSENVWQRVGVWPWLCRDLFGKEDLDNLNTLILCSFHLQWKKENEEIKTTPSNIMTSNLLLPVSSFLFIQSLSCPASSSGPFLQSVPVPPLAPARPPAPVPGLATQTKTHCLAQFNWLV